MNYSNSSITWRAQESPLWEDLAKQQSETLPYLLERYLLLENWKFIDRTDLTGLTVENLAYSLNYVHLLLADAVTVLLSQEERIRALESNIPKLVK